MTKNKFIAPTVSAVVTAIAVLLVTKFVDDRAETLEKGEEAATANQVRQVMEEIMVADIDGKTMTYGQILSSMDKRLTTIETEQRNMKDAIRELAAE